MWVIEEWFDANFMTIATVATWVAAAGIWAAGIVALATRQKHGGFRRDEAK